MLQIVAALQKVSTNAKEKLRVVREKLEPRRTVSLWSELSGGSFFEVRESILKDFLKENESQDPVVMD